MLPKHKYIKKGLHLPAQSSLSFFARLLLFSSGASACACVTSASVASAGINAYSLFYANAIAIAARTLLGLLTTRCERYSYNSCEQKC